MLLFVPAVRRIEMIGRYQSIINKTFGDCFSDRLMVRGATLKSVQSARDGRLIMILNMDKWLWFAFRQDDYLFGPTISDLKDTPPNIPQPLHSWDMFFVFFLRLVGTC